jgi:hypothetical protein
MPFMYDDKISLCGYSTGICDAANSLISAHTISSYLHSNTGCISLVTPYHVVGSRSIALV